MIRIGQGVDFHPLAEGRPCVLGGVAIPSGVGPVGHSDGDVILHALVDALLGASAAGDIGSVFGTTRPEWKDAPSERFVTATREMTGRPPVANVDVTVLGERPRMGGQREEIRAAIARLLDIPVSRVSVKGSTGNGVGALGRGEGIGASVVVLVDVP
jgi:2-C-methyl-D-erythritol 2,4-cyclodiphosphate synthase